MSNGVRILIVESRFYDEITDGLVKGAVRELTAVGAGFKRIVVPGILEIPAAIRFVVQAAEQRANDERYTGFIALGCAIRGETDHYQHVSHEAIRGCQDLALQYSLALGNGILTTHNKQQAMERCLPEINRELSLLPK